MGTTYEVHVNEADRLLLVKALAYFCGSSDSNNHRDDHAMALIETFSALRY